MRRGQVARAVTALAAAALIGAPGAFAATPQAIYKDYADNGQLDKAYSQADLQAALQSATVQGYGSPVVVVTLKPKVETKKPTTGVAGTSKTVKKPAKAAPLATAKRTGQLPFTGAELTIFALVGSALLASGLLLRTTTRQSTRS